MIDANGRRVFAFGGLSRNDNRRLNGETVFEIGSITKEFTSLLLTDMARRGEVALTDPVSKYLPEGVTVPERNNRKIALADLSTHSSGLPRMPSNFNPKDEANPYADYSVQQLYDFLSGYRLTRDIGTQYEYSNLGAGLLGHALSLRARMSYESLYDLGTAFAAVTGYQRGLLWRSATLQGVRFAIAPRSVEHSTSPASTM